MFPTFSVLPHECVAKGWDHGVRLGTPLFFERLFRVPNPLGRLGQGWDHRGGWDGARKVHLDRARFFNLQVGRKNGHEESSMAGWIETRLLDEPWDVDRRITELGLTKDGLVNAVQAARTASGQRDSAASLKRGRHLWVSRRRRGSAPGVHWRRVGHRSQGRSRDHPQRPKRSEDWLLQRGPCLR